MLGTISFGTFKITSEDCEDCKGGNVTCLVCQQFIGEFWTGLEREGTGGGVGGSGVLEIIPVELNIVLLFHFHGYEYKS